MLGRVFTAQVLSLASSLGHISSSGDAWDDSSDDFPQVLPMVKNGKNSGRVR